jgi:hypothetical protein
VAAQAQAQAKSHAKAGSEICAKKRGRGSRLSCPTWLLSTASYLPPLPPRLPPAARPFFLPPLLPPAARRLQQQRPMRERRMRREYATMFSWGDQ